MSLDSYPPLDPVLKQLQENAANIAESTLEVGHTPESLEKVVSKLDKMVEREVTGMHQKGPAIFGAAYKPAACKAGCWFCCTQPVTLPIPEVLRIAHHIRDNWSPEELAALKERLASYRAALESNMKEQKGRKLRHICPLLQEEKCSVWEVRPIVCRGYNSTDVNVCIKKKDDPVNDPPVPASGVQQMIAQRIRHGMQIALHHHRLQPDMCDLSLGLAFALENPDAAERYAAGEMVFEPVVKLTEKAHFT